MSAWGGRHADADAALRPLGWRRLAEVLRQCVDARVDEAAHLGAAATSFHMHHMHRFRRDLEVFALETHAAEIAQIIGAFLPRALQTAT